MLLPRVHNNLRVLLPRIWGNLRTIFSQNSQQYLDAATQDMSQPQDSTTQDAHQSPDSTVQNAQQYQDLFDQDIQQFMESYIQISDQPPDATTHSAHQYQGSDIQILDQPQSTITQSEQQYHGISLQDVQEFLDDATQSAQQSDQNKALAEMERLTKVCNTEDSVISDIERQMHADRQRDAKVNDMMKTITIELERVGISDRERLELQQKSYDLRMVSDELVARYIEQHQNHKDATKKSNYAIAALQLFKDNHRLIAEHNSKNEAQVGLSPNFDYSIDMLREQYDKVLKDIDVVFVEQKRIRGAMLLPGGNALKAQSKQLDNTIRTLQIMVDLQGGSCGITSMVSR
ncbi:hypothetical protein BASA61_006549 [Batrachochytrium salamandrivorans]|nr:hypothetical protein BASA61_006549 [Batrachochytrium salamandrivorans]